MENNLKGKQSTLFVEDSHASHSVLPGSKKAIKMTVTSGLNISGLYKKSGPLGSLVKMLLGLSTWDSTRCYLTWKVKATPAKRLIFQLMPSTPRTKEKGCGFWPTPTTQEPSSYCEISESGRRKIKKGDGSHSLNLGRAVIFWPAPNASDNREGTLNPEWVAWLMGHKHGAKENHWAIEPDIPRVAVGVKDRAKKLKALGNSVVPQIPEILGRLIMEVEGNNGFGSETDFVTKKAPQREQEVKRQGA